MIPRTPVKFKVPITENGTNYVEEVEIDEEKELEYFHVPAHNEVAQADYVYDFKNNLAVRRLTNQGTCYLEPLPEDLPKPADLKRAFQTASQSPSSENSVIAQKYWTVSEQVDKTLLRQEVQDFCGEFPVFRLEEVNLSNETRSGLEKRSTGNFAEIPFCTSTPLIDTRGPDGELACKSHEMLFLMKVRDLYSTWYMICHYDRSVKSLVCPVWKHEYNSYICYESIRCP